MFKEIENNKEYFFLVKIMFKNNYLKWSLGDVCVFELFSFIFVVVAICVFIVVIIE